MSEERTHHVLVPDDAHSAVLAFQALEPADCWSCADEPRRWLVRAADGVDALHAGAAR